MMPNPNAQLAYLAWTALATALRSRFWHEQTDPLPSPGQRQQDAAPGVYALLAGVDRR